MALLANLIESEFRKPAAAAAALAKEIFCKSEESGHKESNHLLARLLLYTFTKRQMEEDDEKTGLRGWWLGWGG